MAEKHTKDVLADALLAAGLFDMSLKARSGYYHDFLSPLDLPCHQLEADLRAVAADPAKPAPMREAAEGLRQRHINGEFDASPAESEAWALSEEGQAVAQELSPAMRGVIGMPLKQ